MPLFPVGDDRNKAVFENSALYEFRICPRPCKAFGVKVDEICDGGQEIDTSTAPTIDFWTNNSAQGSFKYLTELELNPVITSGIYKITFRSRLTFNLEGPDTIVNSPFYIRFDAFARKAVNPEGSVAFGFHSYLPEWVMTFKRNGWGGRFEPGETIEFQITRNHVGDATQTLVFDMCPKDHESKCGGNELRYQFCLCPIHKDNKCSCNYPVKDLHWYIIGTPPNTLFSEDWAFEWTNPETCCINSVELFGDFHGLMYIEYNGDVNKSGQRFLPETPSKVFPDGDERNFESLVPVLSGDEGFRCDRLRYKLVTTGSDQYYYINNHGIQHGLLPGERITVNATIEDENCPGLRELAGIYVETVGLIGGYVQEVVPTTTSTGIAINKYIVKVKGDDILLSSSDFTPYKVGDYVAVQKLGMVPPQGYPTNGQWFDGETFRDPVPHITDQNVPKVDANDGWVRFISEYVIEVGYYNEEFLGSPVIGQEFSSTDLVGETIKIVQGKGEGQIRTITELRVSSTGLRDLCVVDSIFDPAPNSTSRFKIISSTVYDISDKLKIIPYNFKNGPSYTWTGPS